MYWKINIINTIHSSSTVKNKKQKKQTESSKESPGFHEASGLLLFCNTCYSYLEGGGHIPVINFDISFALNSFLTNWT